MVLSHLAVLEVFLHIQDVLLLLQDDPGFVQHPGERPQLSMEGVDGGLAVSQLPHAHGHLVVT